MAGDANDFYPACERRRSLSATTTHFFSSKYPRQMYFMISS